MAEVKSILGVWYLSWSAGNMEISDKVWVNFSQDGRLTGHTGTHAMNGRYQVDDGQFKIVWLTVMRKACLIDTTNQFEPQFLRAFEGASGYKIGESSCLQLFDQNAKQALHFSRD